jgi:hypothetical protein
MPQNMPAQSQKIEKQALLRKKAFTQLMGAYRGCQAQFDVTFGGKSLCYLS